MIHRGDCLDIMRGMPTGSVDLVITSPPYENVRTYGIGFDLRGQDWVDWCAERFREAHRVCKGLTAFVVEGKTRRFRWSATPALLLADLHRAGVKLRKPPLYVRYGIPGSGGPDWLRNRYELIVCAAHGRLPWSDNTAMGQPPVGQPGGRPIGPRGRDGARKRKVYKPPARANPGNLIDCGADTQLGLSSENEAPFHPAVPEFFVRSFCPPRGVVLDPFCGSGTTLAAAKKWGREFIGIDVRQSQVELSQRQIDSVEWEGALHA